MRREAGSFLFGSALNIVCLFLAYKYPAMSDTIINLGLFAGSVLMLLGVYFFLVPSRSRKGMEEIKPETTRVSYKKSPHTEGDHVGDIVYGDKVTLAEEKAKHPMLRLDIAEDKIQNSIFLGVTNRNEGKPLWRCRIKLEKLVTFCLNGDTKVQYDSKQESQDYYFLWNETEAKESKINPHTPFADEHILQKTIQPYEPKSFTLAYIDSRSDETKFLLKFYVNMAVFEIASQDIVEEYIAVDSSVVDMGISLKLVFDFDNEERERWYTRRIRLDKTIQPLEVKGRMTHFPPIINIVYSEWNGENDQEAT